MYALNSLSFPQLIAHLMKMNHLVAWTSQWVYPFFPSRCYLSIIIFAGILIENFELFCCIFLWNSRKCSPSLFQGHAWGGYFKRLKRKDGTEIIIEGGGLLSCASSEFLSKLKLKIMQVCTDSLSHMIDANINFKNNTSQHKRGEVLFFHLFSSHDWQSFS